jgi:hypothetical protein
VRRHWQQKQQGLKNSNRKREALQKEGKENWKEKQKVRLLILSIFDATDGMDATAIISLSFAMVVFFS